MWYNSDKLNYSENIWIRVRILFKLLCHLLCQLLCQNDKKDDGKWESMTTYDKALKSIKMRYFQGLDRQSYIMTIDVELAIQKHFHN